MADTTYALSQAGIIVSGYTHTSYLGSQEARSPSGVYSGWYFVATGTDCTMRMYNAAGTFQVSVDGGSFADVTSPPGAAWGNVNLFTSLTDTAHTVKVRAKSGSLQGLGVDPAAFVVVTGAAPAISAPSNFTASYPLGYGPIKIAGAAAIQNSSYYSAGMNLDSAIRFRAQCSAIHIFGLRNSQGFRLYVDGVADAGGKISYSGTLDFEWLTLATGLDDTAVHEYEIVQVTGGQVSQQMIAAIGLGGTGVLSATPPAARGRMLIIGDSKSMGSIGTDSGNAWGRKFGLAKGYDVWNTATSGELLTGYSGATTNQQMKGIGPMSEGPFDLIMMMIGHNDALNSIPDTIFQIALERQIARLKGNCRQLLLIQDIPTNNATVAAARTAYKAALIAAEAAAGGANTEVIVTDLLWGSGGSPPTSTEINAKTADGVHPTATGYDDMVTLIAPSVPTYTETYPAEADVRVGEPYGPRGNDYAGTLAVPTAAQVLTGVSVDATTGTVVVPATGDVRLGTAYGASSGLTGTLDPSAGGTYPPEGDVRAGEPYGPNGTDYTGSLAVPLASQVLAGVSVDATTGTVVIPIAGEVQDGVTFGAGGGTTGTYDPVTGNYTDPGIAHVEDGTTYTFAGSLLTGTFAGGGSAPTVDQIVAGIVAAPAFVAIKAAVYDSTTTAGTTITLSNGTTQAIASGGRTTTEA